MTEQSKRDAEMSAHDSLNCLLVKHIVQWQHSAFCFFGGF